MKRCFKKILFFNLALLMIVFISCQSSESEDRKDSGLIENNGLIEINGTELYLHSFGEGEPIIVLHGGPGMNHEYFLPHLEVLKEDHQIILYDQRACGKSSYEVDSSSMSMAVLVEDIEGIRKHFGLEKINLMGHSWGGLLAMWYGKTYPKRLNSLLLVNSISADRSFTAEAMNTLNSRISPADAKYADSLTRTPEFAAGDQDAILKAFKFSFATTFFDRSDLERLQLSLAPDPKLQQSKLRYLFSDLQNFDLHEDLKKISCPSLIVHGAYDANPLAAMEKIDAHLPNSELIVLEECGHWAFIEAQDRFKEVVTAFLKK